MGISGCNSTANSDNLQSNAVNEVVFSADDFKSPNSSRTTFDITNDGASFKWSNNDTIGIFPSAGMQTYFIMTKGSGTNAASFTGGDWALKENSEYNAYYPFSIINSYATAGLINKIPVSFKKQKQMGNDNKDNIGLCDFMYAPVATPKDGALSFKFSHLVAFLQLTLTVPEIDNFNKLTISSSNSSDDFVETGIYNLSNSIPNIVPVTKTSSLSMNLSNISTTSAGQTVTLYMMIPPVDFSSKDLKVKLSNDINDYTGVVAEKKNFLAGYFYKLTSPLSKEIKKHITKITDTSSSQNNYDISMSYANNKLSKFAFKQADSEDIDWNQDITYLGNTVVMKGNVDGHYCEQTYILNENGYVASCNTPNIEDREVTTSFEYSASGYLTKAITITKELATNESYSTTYNFTYQNGNLTDLTETGSDTHSYILTYGNNLNKSLIPNYAIEDGLMDYMAAQYMGILGKTCPSLPSSYQYRESGSFLGSGDIIYAFDKDGFITKSTLSTNKGGSEIREYTYE